MVKINGLLDATPLRCKDFSCSLRHRKCAVEPPGFRKVRLPSLVLVRRQPETPPEEEAHNVSSFPADLGR